MVIEMKRRDGGHKNERWKMDLGEKAVLIDPAGKAVIELEPVEALSRFRMPGFGGDKQDLRVQMGDGLATFSVDQHDLRQIEHFLNRTLTATRGKRSPVRAVQVALMMLAGLAAFGLWRLTGSGAPPAPALAQEEQTPTYGQQAQGQLPLAPALEAEEAPTSRPQVRPRTQSQLSNTAAGAPALLLREEATAIEGLRECALYTGRFPPSLVTSDGHLTEVVRQMRANPTAAASGTRLAPGPARTRDEKIVCICRLMSFYTFLRGDQRESAYYGKVVQPGEAERVLLRWRLTPNEYRVIYGDLHVEAVTPDRLARLEATLPK